MPVFEYTARNLKGDLVQDKIDLPNRDDVIAHLRKNRMVVVQVRQAPKAISLGALFKGGIKTRDVVIFTRQFATMINSGLPLVQALDILAQQTENKSLADVTRAVVYDVESGQTLADALRKHPKAFTDLYVNMVAAGEAGGILDTILNRLAQHRPATAQGAGARRPAAQVSSVAVPPDPRHPDLLRRVDPGRPRNPRPHRRQHGDPQRRHGIARVDRGRRHDLGPTGEIQGLP